MKIHLLFNENELKRLLSQLFLCTADNKVDMRASSTKSSSCLKALCKLFAREREARYRALVSREEGDVCTQALSWPL